MRQKSILAVFILLLLAFAGYKYYQFKSGPFEFRSRLLHEHTDEVIGISIQFPNGDELAFGKEFPDWMATDGSRGIRIASGVASELTGNLRQFIAHGILDTTKEAHVALGLTLGQGTQVSLLYEEGEMDQEEVYVISSAPTLPFRRPFGYYRDRSFFRLPLLRDMDSLHYENPTDSLAVRLVRRDNGWLVSAGKEILLDSAAIANFWTGMNAFPPPGFADDFDEFSAAGFPRRQLTVWRRTGGIPHSLICYYRKKHSMPFVWASSQHPYDFFASDSTGVFRAVISRLDSLARAIQLPKAPDKKPKAPNRNHEPL
ncbi:MAG: hypothetical protein IPH16_17670 [Haliscomenobacter sp.]|nr:hypothetical protein [Haliscomenobacter sp.]